MVRPSILFAGIFTFLSLLGSIIATAFSLYIHFHCGTACQNSLFTSFMTIDVFLSAVSLLGMFCLWCKSDNFLFAYLGSLLVLIFVFGISIGIVFFFLNTDENKALVLLREYRPGNNRNAIWSCSIDAQACGSLEKDANQTTENFHKQDFSPVKSGCCKAPIDCGLGFKNTNHLALFWTGPKSCIAVENNECFEWSNPQDRFCYYCNSCKAAILNSIKKWRNFAKVNICIVVLFIFLFSLGCCAVEIRHSNKQVSPLVDAP